MAAIAMTGELRGVGCRRLYSSARRVSSASTRRWKAAGASAREGPAMDVVLDPIDGRNMLAEGRSGAISVVAAAPRGAMWSTGLGAVYEKIVVNGEAAHRW